MFCRNSAFWISAALVMRLVTGSSDVPLHMARTCWAPGILRGAGAKVVAEPRPMGMNRAAALGRRRAVAARPGAPVAVIVADLPGLHPSDLDAAVLTFHDEGAPLFVADREGTGTTLLIHGPDQLPGYAFGCGSAAAHQRLGYRPARRVPPSLRWDLDTPEDLLAHPLADLQVVTP